MTTTRELTASQLENQLGRRLAARLDQAGEQVPHDISERLRVARAQALAKHKAVQVQQAAAAKAAVTPMGGGTAALQMGGGDPFSIWNRLGSWFPLLALLIGLMVINVVQDEYRAREVADVDVELLTDDLPPNAWTDPGFSEFLRSNHQL